ncbi:MAG: LacI family DNA-binding transcriptional regulator [Spirochaetota bacterium]
MDNKKLNIAKIADLAGVSTATVSRVINKYPYVKEETRKKVMEVIDETNYRINAIARNLRRRKTHSIGVIISNVLSPFYSIIAKSVEDVAIRHNFSTVLCNGGDDPLKERMYLKVLHENRVDGIILSPTGKNKDYLSFLKSLGTPILFLDRVVEGVSCDSVVVNNREAACSGVKYMIEKGCRKIGFISGPRDRMTGMHRLEGYRDALEQSGMGVKEELIKYGDFSLESGREKAAELLMNSGIDSLFVANTDMATGAYQSIKENNLHIPQDIAFMMFDNPGWASLVTPGITAISQPVYTLGSTAADLLFKRITEAENYMDSGPVKVVLEAKLVIRQSV